MAATLEDARQTADEVLGLARDRLTDLAEQANDAVPGLSLPVPKKKRRWLRLLIVVAVGAGVFVIVKQVTKSQPEPSSPGGTN